MGEAKLRGSSPPTAPEKVRRAVMRFWRLYPMWFRTMVSFELKVALVFLGVALVSLILAQLLIRR